MKSGALWKITVTVNREGEEAVAELFHAIFGKPPSIYSNAKTGKAQVAIYSDAKPGRPVLRLIKAGILGIRSCGLQIGPGKCAVARIRRQDWAESWKKHFKPMEIGHSLLIKPSWIKQRPRKGQAVIILDPGLSFGTGHHATTSFCLHQIARNRRAEERQAFLDIGTGTGILAIAADKLGYAPVHAFDFDPEAVRVASENARLNGVSRHVRIKRADLTLLPTRSTRKYDLVCANLISTLLVSERRKIINFLNPGGILVIAGILKSEFGGVESAFNALGLSVIRCKREKEWCSGALCRKAN